MQRTQLTTWLRTDLRDRLKILGVKRKKKLWQLFEKSVEAYLCEADSDESPPETPVSFPKVLAGSEHIAE